MNNLLRKFIITGAGTGYLPVAPGTWGSAAVCGVFLLAAWGSGGKWHCAGGTMLAIAVLATVGCVALGRFAEQAFGKKDPSRCTLDEWAGQAVALLVIPTTHPSWSAWLGWLVAAGAAFLAFRLFDILKPFPARRLEKLPFGWGIVADDLVAGVYANFAAQLVLRWALQMN